jgi:hypothetical protein
VIEQLTYSLNQMIRHRRQAEASPAEADYHHAEALRYRAEAHKLEMQLKVARQLWAEWVREN